MARYSPFIRRVRRAARVALYGSLALVGALAALLGSWLERTLPLGDDQVIVDAALLGDPAVELLRDYVRVDTSQATGSEVDGALFLAERLRAMGLEPHVEVLGEGRANLWAVLEGREREALVLHNHIDVSDALDAEEWARPPFEAAVEGAYVYGRGVFDMKSITVAQLMALEARARADEPPRRSVIFLATGSEEAGSELGVQWVLRQHPELAERFWAVLTEGAIVEPLRLDEVKYWGIEFAQKRYAYGWACARERETLERWREELREWQRTVRVPDTHPWVDRFLASYAPTREKPWHRNRLERLRLHADPVTLGGIPDYLKAFFVDEVHVSPVEADPSGGGYRVRLIVHLLPGHALAPALERLLPPWLTHSVDVVVGEAVGADAASPVDGPVWEVLEGSLADHPVGPLFLTWSVTDARFFRALGIPTYGYSPLLVFNTESLKADGTNERINLPGLLRGVETYRQTVARLVE
jgi:acetylornithine deacetylase/succinyl-diaminopimelate desuccinylase-like protein